jgi:hypothetical protein
LPIRLNAPAERAKLTTFRQCTEEYLAANESKWRNAKHRKEWHATLKRYAFPVFGNLSVAARPGGQGAGEGLDSKRLSAIVGNTLA